ncbi:hypothetical protein WOC76_04255 [Methylocystis sp. IM3]|uniref:hypothetical protein n=1 Tax=unclassified Methylocystis TaxID=2625913 RepID=UPI0030F87AC4
MPVAPVRRHFLKRALPPLARSPIGGLASGGPWRVFSRLAFLLGLRARDLTGQEAEPDAGFAFLVGVEFKLRLARHFAKFAVAKLHGRCDRVSENHAAPEVVALAVPVFDSDDGIIFSALGGARLWITENVTREGSCERHGFSLLLPRRAAFVAHPVFFVIDGEGDLCELATPAKSVGDVRCSRNGVSLARPFLKGFDVE